jgi:hypothetical protein
MAKTLWSITNYVIELISQFLEQVNRNPNYQQFEKEASRGNTSSSLQDRKQSKRGTK